MGQPHTPQGRAKLARNLRALRLRRGFSVDAFADATGFSTNTIGSIEIAESEPNAEHLFGFASILRVPVSELMADIRSDDFPGLPERSERHRLQLIEEGNVQVQLYELVQLSSILGVSVDEMFTGIEWEGPAP